MDKYEYKVRADEIKDLIAQGEYVQAAEIADTIDWRRVKSVMMLCTISDLYKINRRYEDARNMLLLAYERRPGGRTICYSLCELSIKMEDYVPAVNYYKEFVQVAPRDPGRYILQYKLYEAQDVSLEERIGVLEELKKRDYREKWAYELAYLYHRVGLGTRCVEECDELILWFGEGKYVVKAMELKMLHQPLTPSQQEKYDHRFGDYGQEHYGSRQAEVSQKQPYYGGRQEPVAQEQFYYETGQEPVAQEQFYYGNGQEPVAQEQFYYGNGQEPVAQEQFYYGNGQEPVSQEQFYYGPGQEPAPREPLYYAPAQEQPSGYDVGGKTQEYGTVSKGLPMENVQKIPEQPEEIDIQVKPMDMGQYNTINLQAEIAAGLREVLEDDQNASRESEITRTIMAPMLETESLDLPEIEEVDADDLEPEAEVMEDSEVFFGETGEIGHIQPGAQAPFGKETAKEIVPEIGSGRKTVSEDVFYHAATATDLKKETVEVSVSAEGMTEKAVKETDGAEAAKKQPERAAVTGQQTAETVQEQQDASDVTAGTVQERQGASDVTAGTVQERQDASDVAAGTVQERQGASDVAAGTVQEQQGASGVTAESVQEQQGASDVTAEIVQERQGASDMTAESAMAQFGQESRAEQQALTAQPPKEIASVLSQESDGQIRLVMPESEQIEKQITGQMSLEDILREWERMKQENVEKRREEVRQHVLQHTGEMFTAFEASVRDGLLEQLESGNADAQGSAEGAWTEEDVSGDEAEDESFNEETGQEIPAEESIEDDLEEIEDWDSPPEESKEELARILREAEQEVIFGDADEVEELEEIEEPQESDDEDESGPGAAETSGPEPKEAAGQEPQADDTGKPELEETAAQESQPGETGQPGPEPIRETAAAGEPEPDKAGTEETRIEETGIEETQAPAAQKPQTNKTNKTAKQKTKTDAKPAGEDAKQPSIEREKGKMRSLTKEEKELYGPYIQSRASREQLVQAIDNISMAAYTGNIVITGEEGMDTVSLAKNMIREVQMTDSNFAGKVAKISGQALNKKDVESTIQQLKSGALIIQKASGMDADTAKRLHKALQQESFGIIIILEDVKKAMNRFLGQYPKLAGCFTARMDVESLSNGTLVAFGRKYAREREYSIDDMGILALHTRIDEMQTSDHVVTVLEVKELVDSAIKHANRKTLKHFFDILLARRYDEEDMIILSERDFV